MVAKWGVNSNVGNKNYNFHNISLCYPMLEAKKQVSINQVRILHLDIPELRFYVFFF